MFDSVLARRNVPSGKLASAGVSAGIYGVLILAVVFGVSQTRKEVVQPVEVKLFTAAPAKPAPPPPPAGGARKAVEKKPIEKKPIEKKPDTVVEPKVETKPEEPTNTDDKPSDPAGVPGGVSGGVPGGVVGGVVGGVPGGVVGGVPGGVPGGTAGGTNAVLPFGAGMTPTQRVSGPAPVYTPQAMAARVEGKVLVRCVITVEGTVQNCEVLKGLPFLTESVLTSLSQSRYKPVVFQGRTVAVRYVLTFNFKVP